MISIITPCKNAEKTIRRTIESVINQGLDDYEYIIIDGMSDDRTIDIVKEYMTINDRISLVSEHDNSMTEALNKGMRRAKGEWVCSINADDEYLPGTLNKVIERMRETRCDLLIAASNNIKNEKLSFVTYPRFMKNRFLLCILDSSVPECSSFFKRSCIEELGYFDESIKYTQDYEMYIRMAYKGYKIEYLDEVVSNFYLSNDQYSTKLAKPMFRESLRYNKHKVLFWILKKTHINNKVKQVCGWVIK